MTSDQVYTVLDEYDLALREKAKECDRFNELEELFVRRRFIILEY
jgi:hypothetical protein